MNSQNPFGGIRLWEPEWQNPLLKIQSFSCFCFLLLSSAAWVGRNLFGPRPSSQSTWRRRRRSYHGYTGHCNHHQFFTLFHFLQQILVSPSFSTATTFFSSLPPLLFSQMVDFSVIQFQQVRLNFYSFALCGAKRWDFCVVLWFLMHSWFLNCLIAEKVWEWRIGVLGGFT